MASQHLQFRSVLTHAHALVALATAATSFVIAIQYGAFVAGGGDSSGYVSQADLWLKGDLLVEPRPWSEMAEHPRSAWLFCPLGYRPGPVRGTIVPTYSPGLPLMMAAFLAGVAASGALATRPNLVLAVIPFVLYYAGPLLRRHPGRESAGTLMAFLAPVTATAILIAGLHA